MSSNAQAESAPGLPASRGAFVWPLRAAIGYCALSSLTIPFMGHLWLGETPVLALIQVPKILLAGWLRTHVVMRAIALLGFSRGSFSPDYILARAYGLALVYLIPMVIVGVFGFRHRRRKDRSGFVAIAFVIAAALDYAFTLIFADRPSLTIY